MRLLLQLAQQVEDLGLHGDVEGGGRLVGDEQVGVARHRSGDEDTLGHAAGDLVRVGAERPRRIGDADAGEQRQRLLLGLRLAHPEGDPHRLDELAADRERRVEVAHRLLRHVGDPRAAQLVDRLDVGTDQLDAVEHDRAAEDLAGRRQQAEHGERRLGLARAGLTDEADDLAAVDGERHVVDDRLVATVARLDSRSDRSVIVSNGVDRSLGAGWW